VTSSTFVGQIASLFDLKNIADKADKASDGGYPQLAQECGCEQGRNAVSHRTGPRNRGGVPRRRLLVGAMAGAAAVSPLATAAALLDRRRTPRA
jgi:hypothetical protein